MKLQEMVKENHLHPISLNSDTIERELKWFEKILDVRFGAYFGGVKKCNIQEAVMPDLSGDTSVYATFVKDYQMGFEERLILILSLIPSIRPQMLDVFCTKNANYDRFYTEFGGRLINNFTRFVPTGETVLFILAGNDLPERFKLMKFFDHNHFFRKHNILKFEIDQNDSLLSSELKISGEFLTYLTTGQTFKPDYSSNFPASLLTTKMDWDDLVVEPEVLDEISEINAWIEYGDRLLHEFGLSKQIKKGYRSLFYGPPGTGKTLTATLLGKSNGMDVYRIDLSMVVSKYIGETEKNLSRVFDYAENKNWILFFDEADALFGKRTAAKDSKDRYANQEVSYLLQRIEDFAGVVILATNLKSNMDDAFARRFQSMIYFPMPKPDLRLDLWKKAFSGKFNLDKDVDLKGIAEEFELAGGAIINVVRYCALMALKRKSETILLEDIITGIRKELRKEGKTV